MNNHRLPKPNIGLCILLDTLVPEVFLDFSSFREASNTSREYESLAPLCDSCSPLCSLSQLSHAEKNQENPLGSG